MTPRTTPPGTLSQAPTRGELGTLLVCTVRYSLGRKSYIVSDTARLVMRFYNGLTDVDKGVILANVETHLGILNPQDPPDIRRAWESLAEWIKGQS